MHPAQEDSPQRAAQQAQKDKKEAQSGGKPWLSQNLTTSESGAHSSAQQLAADVASAPSHPFEQAFDARLFTCVFSIFELPPQILLQIYPENFMQSLITNSMCEEAEFNIQKQEGCETYFFEGYPAGNYIKQICKVLTLWNKLDRFPILFQPLACLALHDETEEVVEMLTKLTPQLKYVFRELEHCDHIAVGDGEEGGSPRQLQKELTDFFVALQPRGILTCLGVRRTVSSIDEQMLPEKNQLILQFNRLYTILTEEQLIGNSNPPILTVGARAIQKHMQRANGAFWGPLAGKSDKKRNEQANRKIRELFSRITWINVHTLSRTTADQIIIELRQSEGFGARWDINYMFKGLIEPQVESANAKKSQQSAQQQQIT